MVAASVFRATISRAAASKNDSVRSLKILITQSSTQLSVQIDRVVGASRVPLGRMRNVRENRVLDGPKVIDCWRTLRDYTHVAQSDRRRPSTVTPDCAER